MSNNATLAICLLAGLAGGISLLVLGRGDAVMTGLGSTLLVGGVFPLFKRITDADKRIDSLDKKTDRAERCAQDAMFAATGSFRKPDPSLQP